MSMFPLPFFLSVSQVRKEHITAIKNKLSKLLPKIIHTIMFFKRCLRLGTRDVRFASSYCYVHIGPNSGLCLARKNLVTVNLAILV